MDFMCKIVELAISSGAKTINIPDTVGYTIPSEFTKIITTLKNKVPNIDKAILSVHCHNDLGLAVANSLAGVQLVQDKLNVQLMELVKEQVMLHLKKL